MKEINDKIEIMKKQVKDMKHDYLENTKQENDQRMNRFYKDKVAEAFFFDQAEEKQDRYRENEAD